MNIEQKTLTSVEVAEMVGKPHNDLMKDIRRYTSQFNEGNISHVEFFTENTYLDKKGQERPAYLQDVITGCNAQIRMDGDPCGV